LRLGFARNYLVGEIMTLHAAAVEILVEKAKFEPVVAVAIAEAIEVSVVHAQFVTIPVFEAKIQELKAEIRAVDASLRQVITGVEAKFEAKLEATQAQLVAQLEKVKAELMRWVLLAMLGSVALTAATTGLVKALPL
jgi:ribosomal protein L6P/L9E